MTDTITTDLTPVPSRQSPSTFSSRMDTWLGKISAWTTEANALATGANTNKLAAEAAQAAAEIAETNAETAVTDAEAAAAEAADAAAAASLYQNYVGDWVDQTGAGEVPTTVKHNGAFYILNEDVVDITAHTPGVSGVWDRIFSALLDDTTPQLGGDLDTNGKYIVVDSSYGVKDENGNEIFLFTATASAVNEITIKNAATGNGPQIQATGGDTNIPVSIIPKGTGSLEIGGSATISPIGAATDINLTLAPKGDGVVSLADKVLSRAVMKDYAETISSKGSVSGAVTLDLEKGNVFVAKVSGATTTFTFSNASTSASVGFTLVLTDGGSQTVNWPAAVIWTDGAPPSLTASGVDVLTFLAIGDPATTWYGFLSGSDMS